MPLILLSPYRSAVVDPNISSVSLLMHMDGNNNGTSFVDVKGKSIGLVGSPVTRTDIKKFGTASAYFNGTSYLTVPDSPDFNFGTGDFTIEFWIYPLRGVTQEVFTKGAGIQIYVNNDAIAVALSAFNSGAYFVNAPGVAPLTMNAWSHIALVVSGNFYYLFVNGTRYQIGENTLRVNTGNAQVAIGAYTAGTQAQLLPFFGNLDEVRVSKGVARYTQNFSVASQPFPDN